MMIMLKKWIGQLRISQCLVNMNLDMNRLYVDREDKEKEPRAAKDVKELE